MLVRPTSVFLFAGVLVAWLLVTDWRSALRMFGIAVATGLVVVIPWTVRNAVVDHGFIPISMQSVAAYGTFNSQSANDPVYPYAWRPTPPDAVRYLDPRHPLSEVRLQSKLDHLAISYVENHPFSVAPAFFWNGITRLWDIRRPSHALAEVPFEGRSHLLALIGLIMYYALAPLALFGVWRVRHRRELVYPLLAIALGASIVFTIASGTRYRAPFEPMIAALACVAVLGDRRTVDPLFAQPVPEREPAAVSAPS
jgi:hypothetical protein